MTDPLMTPEVLTRIDGPLGRITLNRPKALHALNLAMCEAMTEALLAWQTDPTVQAVLIDHSGERGFCAGGDIRMIAESGKTDAAEAKAFFHTEYRLNHLLFHYTKPVVAIIDGVVMGGGVGISDPAPIRIATERTTYAMPETGIGLFPDVGGGWFLPRLSGQAGIWLALTGARLKAADCLRLGLATHYVESARLEDLKIALLSGRGDLAEMVAAFASDPGPAPLEPHLSAIDRLFAADRMEDILADLETEGSEWALAQHKTLLTKSPQSLKVSLRQMRLGATLASFADNMAMEYRLGGRVVRTPDFQEGVRAVIVDKDNAPVWSPPTVAEVSDAEIEALFAPLADEPEWTPLPGLSV